METTPQLMPTSDPFVPAENLIDVEGIEGRLNNSLLVKVQRLVQNYPDRALDVIRGWMAEPRYH